MEKVELPKKLKRLQSDLFSIIYVDKNTRSFGKLEHAMEAYPDDKIITFDDDIIYPNYLIENLVSASKDRPGTVVANICRDMRYNENEGFATYSQWSYSGFATGSSFLPLGYAGVLYPPKCLHEDFNRDDIFIETRSND